jgi:predicted nucleic acid-binding protein
MILVDSSVLIDFFKGNENNDQCSKFETILTRNIPFGINSVIYQEVLQGARTDKEYKLLNEYLMTQTFYHLRDPIQSYAEAASIYILCRKKGITVRSTIDCIIAQTAIEHDLHLLHNDKDFDAMAKAIKLKIY